MRRPWLWIIGGRWDRLAALTRFLTVLSILFLYTGYNQAVNRADHNSARLARLYQKIGNDTARISQLEDALRNGLIPIPPPSTTTTSTVLPRRRPGTSTTGRPAAPHGHGGTTTTTTRPRPTTTTTSPCPTPTVPVDGGCVIPPSTTIP